MNNMKLYEILEAIKAADNVKLDKLSKELKYSAAGSPRSFGAKIADELKKVAGAEVTYNDVAIYTAIVLAKLKQKPLWTLDEIRDTITSKKFMQEHYVDLVAETDGMTDAKKQAKARELANWIATRHGEFVQVANSHIAASIQKKGKAFVASQYSVDELNDIFAAIKKLSARYGKSVGKDTAYLAMQRLLAELSKEYVAEKAGGGEIPKDVASAGELISKVSGKRVVWAEPPFDISSANGLERYRAWNVNQRSKLVAAMGYLSKRRKVVGELLKGDSAGSYDVRTLIGSRPEVQELAKAAGGMQDSSELANLINAMAAKLAKTEEIVGHPDIADHDDPESEIAGILTYVIRNPSAYREKRTWDKKSRSGKRRPKNVR